MKIGRIETFILGTGGCSVAPRPRTAFMAEVRLTSPRARRRSSPSAFRAMAPHGIGRCAFNIRHTAIAEPSAHYRCDMTPRWREWDSNRQSLSRQSRSVCGLW